MRRLVLITATLTLLALPAAASAHKPSLSVARAKQAIAHVERGTTATACRRIRALQVDCQISEPITEGEWAGWTYSFTAYAILHRNGHIAVTTSMG